MNIATLFSGIGAPEIAAYSVFDNPKIILSCEIDKFARKSYEAIHGHAPHYEDVHDVPAVFYQNRVDLLVGGSPCQSFSFSGLRKGLADERGQLIYQFHRIVDEMLPKVFLFENVKGFRTIDKGETMRQFEESFRQIGYAVKSAVLNTKDYGLPQNRERYFLVGFLSKTMGERFKFPDPIPLDKTLADIIEDEVDEKYYLSEKTIAGFIAHSQRHTKRGNGFRFAPKDPALSISACVTTRGGSRTTDTFIKVAGRLSCKGHDIIKRVYSTHGLSPTITSVTGGGHTPKIIQRPRGKNNGNLHAISQTVSSSCFDRNNPIVCASRGRGEGWKQRLEARNDYLTNSITTVQKDNLLAYSETIRRLTPKECWRLQGFPDWAHDAAKDAGVSDTQRYKQAGNAMSVNVIEAIFERIAEALYTKRERNVA